MEKERNTLNSKGQIEPKSEKTIALKRNKEILEENDDTFLGAKPCSPHHAKTDHDGTLLDDTLQDVNDLQDMALLDSKVANIGRKKYVDALDSQFPGTQTYDSKLDAKKDDVELRVKDSVSSSAISEHEGSGKDKVDQNALSRARESFSEEKHYVDPMQNNGEKDCFAETSPFVEREVGQNREATNIGNSSNREAVNDSGSVFVNQRYNGSPKLKAEKVQKGIQGFGEKNRANSRSKKNDHEKREQFGFSKSKTRTDDLNVPKEKKFRDLYNSESSMSRIPSRKTGRMNFNKETSKKAAHLGKLTGAATSGNSLIAAYQAAKAGPAVTKTIATFGIGMLIFIISLTSLFLYALPTSIFEFAETYTKDYYAEKYEAAIFGSESEIHWAKFVEGIKIGGEIAGDYIESLGESLKNFVASYIPFFSASNSDNQSDDIESYTSDGRELKVMQLESAEKSTLEDKIEAVQKKIQVRSEDIEDAVRKISDGNNSQIAQAVEAYYNAEGYYDDFQVNTTVNTYGLSKEGAIAIMGLYMVQEAGSLDDVRLSSLLQWLGFYDGTQSERLDFNVLGIPCKVKSWRGSFLPQYLNEQKHQEETKYHVAKTAFEDYQTAAVDLILEVNIPKIDDIPVYELKQQQEDGSIKTIGIATVNIKIQPRELGQIADLMGLWIGDLTKRQEYMPSNLTVNMIDSVDSKNYGTGSYEWLEGGELIAYTPQHNLHSNFVGIEGQCTWFAADRLYQLYKETNGAYGADLTGLHMGNGGEWAENARAYGYKVDNVAQIGKAACFVPGVTQNHPGDAWQPFDAYAGHIAIVERVNPDGSIIVSEFWGHYVDYQVHFSYFTKETAATIQYIDFTVNS